MDLKAPACNEPDCEVALVTRPAMARRGDRTVNYEVSAWRCARCADPFTGQTPLEWLDAQLIDANDAALAAAWKRKYGEDVPPSGRPGRKTDAARTERVSVLFTPDELALVDARRGRKSRSEFLRDVVTKTFREA